MILLTIDAKVNPNKRIEFLQVVNSLFNSKKNNIGFLSYNAYQNTQDTNSLYLVQLWEDIDMLNDHLQSETFTVFLGAMKILLIGEPVVEIHTIYETETITSIDELIGRTFISSSVSKQNKEILDINWNRKKMVN
ncbi:putative quinol monooxygenase [Bacteroidota bacterium]